MLSFLSLSFFAFLLLVYTCVRTQCFQSVEKRKSSASDGVKPSRLSHYLLTFLLSSSEFWSEHDDASWTHTQHRQSHGWIHPSTVLSPHVSNNSPHSTKRVLSHAEKYGPFFRGVIRGIFSRLGFETERMEWMTHVSLTWDRERERESRSAILCVLSIVPLSLRRSFFLPIQQRFVYFTLPFSTYLVIL